MFRDRQRCALEGVISSLRRRKVRSELRSKDADNSIMSGILISLVPNSKLPRWVCASPSWVNSANASGFLNRMNLLVNYLQIGNINGCGNILRAKCTKPFGKPRASKQGNDLADRNNHLDWTIRSVYPKCAMIAYGFAYRDRKLMGLRKSSTSNEGLRYDPASCESMGISAGVGSAFQIIC